MAPQQEDPKTANLKWSAPTTIMKWCPVFQKDEQAGPSGTPNKRKLKDLTNAQKLSAAADEAKRLKKENDILKERIEEVEQERDGNTITHKTTTRQAFDNLTRLWSKDKCRQLAKLLLDGDYPDAPKGPSASSKASKSTSPRGKRTKPQHDEHAANLQQLKAMRGEPDAEVGLGADKPVLEVPGFDQR